MDCSLPHPSLHGIFQARVLEWGAIAFSRGSSQPRDQTWVSHIVSSRFTVPATREVSASGAFFSSSSMLRPRVLAIPSARDDPLVSERLSPRPSELLHIQISSQWDLPQRPYQRSSQGQIPLPLFSRALYFFFMALLIACV